MKTFAQKAVAENPFYGMKNTLNLGQQLSKLGDNPNAGMVEPYLNLAWNECNTQEKKELFYIILFSIGDIQNREHNIFRKKGIKNVEGGGVSARKVFLYILSWILKKDQKQFYKFLPIIGEYYNLDGMMFYEIKTDRYKGNVQSVTKLDANMEKIIAYIASVLKNPKTTENEKKLWAKWLWHIPTTTRQRKFVVTEIGLKAVRKKYGVEYNVGDVVRGTRQKQAQTKAKDTWTLNNIHLLSLAMDWEIKKHTNNVDYVGYKAFKKQYLADSEATMFSSQKIKELDKVQLFNWFDQLPSGARFRTQTRLLSKEGDKFKSKTKWISNKGFNIGDVFQDWMKSKEVAQQELRNLTKEDKEVLKKEDPSKLKQMEKAAKVNTGATTLLDTIAELLSGKIKTEQDVNLVADSILNKMKLEVPVMVVADISGSMSSNYVAHKGVNFSSRAMAQLLTTMFLLKNPNPDLQQMFIRFDSVAEVVVSGQKVASKGSNRFMSTAEKVVGGIVDPKNTFIQNYNNVGQYIIARGGTDFNTVAKELYRWVNSDSAYKSSRIEQINQYPVWVVVSDGDMNSSYNAAQSMAQFQQSMKQWFGWEGVVVVWDCATVAERGSSKFEGLENVIYYAGANTSIVNNIFTNIHDLDIIDVYTPLKSLYQSNRYQPVKELVS